MNYTSPARSRNYPSVERDCTWWRRTGRDHFSRSGGVIPCTAPRRRFTKHDLKYGGKFASPETTLIECSLLRGNLDVNSIGVRLRLACFLCVALSLLLTARAQTTGGESLRQGSAAEAVGHYSEAVSIYESLLKSGDVSNMPPALRDQIQVHLARDYFFLHRYQDSLNVLAELRGRAGFQPKSLSALPVLLTEGLDYLELNRLTDAIKSLNEALSLDPHSGTARMALADAMARSGKLMDAAQYYSEQLRSTPDLADAWYKLSVVYLQLGQKTLEEFEKQHPDDPVAKQVVAESLLAQGDYWHAARTIFPLIQQESATSAQVRDDSRFQPGLRADLGMALLQLNFIQAADKEFQYELVRNPECADALLGYSETEALLGNWQSAMETFSHLENSHPLYLKEAFESGPAEPVREKYRAGQLALPVNLVGTPTGKLWELWMRGMSVASIHLEPSKSTCSNLLAAPAKSPGVWLSEPCYSRLSRYLLSRRDLTEKEQLTLSEAEYRLGHYKVAETAAARALERSPGNAWAMAWLVKSYDALSYRCLAKLSSMNPHSAQIHELLARSFADQSRWKQAIEEYNLAIQAEPGSADLHMGLGTVYWQAGQWPEAEKELRQVLAMSPQSAVAAYELGDCYVQMRLWKEAIPYLREAEHDPSVSVNALLDLAKVEDETGNPQAAIATLERVLKDDRNGSIHYRLGILYRKTGNIQKSTEMFAVSQRLRSASLQLNQEQARALEKEREQYENLDKPVTR